VSEPNKEQKRLRIIGKAQMRRDPGVTVLGDLSDESRVRLDRRRPGGRPDRAETHPERRRRDRRLDDA
jgi:hypothetical protein